jgi:hypothetical protein
MTLGCSSGGSDAVTATKAKISFSLISTATMPFRINSIQINASLPAGFSVATEDANKISDGFLFPGSAVEVSSLALIMGGTYSAQKVEVMLAAVNSNIAGFGPGEIFILTCTVAASTDISAINLSALENAVTFRATGWDPSAATNPSPLNTYLKPKITITPTE